MWDERSPDLLRLYLVMGMPTDSQKLAFRPAKMESLYYKFWERA